MVKSSSMRRPTYPRERVSRWCPLKPDGRHWGCGKRTGRRPRRESLPYWLGWINWNRPLLGPSCVKHLESIRMAESSITVIRVETSEGAKDYVTCLPHEHVFARGLAPEAIIGVLLRPLEKCEAITPAVFAPN